MKLLLFLLKTAVTYFGYLLFFYHIARAESIKLSNPFKRIM